MYSTQYSWHARLRPRRSAAAPANVPKTMLDPKPPTKSTAMSCLLKPYDEYSAYTYGPCSQSAVIEM